MTAATAPILGLSPSGQSDGPPASGRPWPRRRRWLRRVSQATHLTTGCRAWLLLLADRSDELGKPVWGRQTRMADQMGVSARTVRRYAVEAEAAGYLKVTRFRPLRDDQGRYYRRASNVYRLTTPQADPPGGGTAPRRVQKAGYCVLKSRSHLPDSHGRPTAPSGLGETALVPAEVLSADENGEITGWLDPDAHQAGLEQARAALRAARPGGLRR